eukprot:7561360-Pyramimonas_sp.AAC.1
MQARTALNGAVEALCQRKVRGPRSLWPLLYTDSWRRPTRDTMCGSLTLDDATRALDATPASSLPRISCWS